MFAYYLTYWCYEPISDFKTEISSIILNVYLLVGHVKNPLQNNEMNFSKSWVLTADFSKILKTLFFFIPL